MTEKRMRAPIKIPGMWRPRHASLGEAHKRHLKVSHGAYAEGHPLRSAAENTLIGNLLWGPVGTQNAMDLGRYNDTGVRGLSWRERRMKRIAKMKLG